MFSIFQNRKWLPRYYRFPSYPEWIQFLVRGRKSRKMVVAFERVVCHFLRSNCCTPKSAVLFCTHLPGLVPVTCVFSKALDACCLHCKVLLTLDSNVNMSLSLKPTVGWNSHGKIRDLVTPERAPTIKKNIREK